MPLLGRKNPVFLKLKDNTRFLADIRLQYLWDDNGMGWNSNLQWAG